MFYICIEYCRQACSLASTGADAVNHSQLRDKELIGAVQGKWAACLTLTSVVLTLSTSAKCLAPSGPKLFRLTLKCENNGNLALGGADVWCASS